MKKPIILKLIFFFGFVGINFISCKGEPNTNHTVLRNKLVYLKSIPTSNDVLTVTFKKTMGTTKALLSQRLFMKLLSHDNTRILNPDNKLDAQLLTGYSYSPWYTIDFTTAKGNHTITLSLGGLGFMTLPNGTRGIVLFDFSDLKEEDKRLLSYYKKIKKKALAKLSEDEDDAKKITQQIGYKTIIYNVDEGAIQINNIVPHPSKEFSENMGIFQYTIKEGYPKLTFWRRGIQILETDSYYLKTVLDFINAAEMLTSQEGTYGVTMRLMKDDILVFPNGLKIALTDFSHKKTFENQRSPEIAHLELSDKHSKERWFTIQRDEDEHGKFITSYESKKWKNYNIELTGFAYDEYIDMIVTEKKSNTSFSKDN